MAMPLFHVGGIGYALFGISAGVPTIMTREPDAASADRRGASRCDACVLRAAGDRPVPGRRRGGERHDLGPALHGLRGRAHAVALAAASARDVARDELRPGVRTDGTVRRGHGAQRRRTTAIPRRPELAAVGRKSRAGHRNSDRRSRDGRPAARRGSPARSGCAATRA